MALIQGTNGNDLNIRGSESTTEGDYIKAGNGSDYVFANAGDDLIHGGWDNDFISAGAGDDDIFGDAGNDYLRGDDGADWFHFTVGNGNDKVIDFRPLEGDEWFLYGIDEGAVRYKEYNFFGVSGTYVYLDGQKDTINFVSVNQAALDDTLEFRDIAGYDWSGVTLI